jgi:hypothetical protein
MKYLITALTILILLALALPALAQETPPDPTVVVVDPPPLGEEVTRADAQEAPPVTPDQIVKPAEVFGAIVALLGMFAAGVGPLAQVITSVYKFVTARWFPNSKAAQALPVFAVIIPVVLTVLFWIADAFGLSGLYVVVADNLVTLVPIFLSMIGAFVGQQFIYQKVMKPLDAPLVGKTSAQMMRRPKAYNDRTGAKNSSTVYDTHGFAERDTPAVG